MPQGWGLRIFKDYQELSRAVARYLTERIKHTRNLLLCLASGNSPKLSYQLLVDSIKKKKINIDHLKILKLDEWVGVQSDSLASCEGFIQEEIIVPLNIPSQRYFGFTTMPDSGECERMDTIVRQHGPIDISILGLGINGHIGFNEPSDALPWGAHIVPLSADSLKHPMLSSLAEQPSHGITLGMDQLMQSKEILLIVNGQYKRQVVKQLKEAPISTRLPVSLLRLHPHVELFIDEEALAPEMASS